MTRMSRAGRKAQLLKALRRHFYQCDNRWLTVGQVAHKIGLKSSTNVKSMLWELVNEHQEVLVNLQYDITYFGYAPLEQMPLPERFITINGKQHRVAQWAIADMGSRKNG